MNVGRAVGIPKRLQDDSLRFIKLHDFVPSLPESEQRCKDAREVGWNSVNNYPHEHFKSGRGNYGVAAGFGGLFFVDSDSQECESILRHSFPETFTVRTGSGNLHAYFKRTEPYSEGRAHIPLKNGELNVGSLRFKNAYVVGPGSRHPNGEFYRVESDKPIATIALKQVMSVFEPYMSTGGMKGAVKIADSKPLPEKGVKKALQEPKIKRLFEGDTSGYPSRSEAELALCSLLRRAGLSRGQIASLMKISLIGKWSEKPTSYKNRTLDKAFAASEQELLEAAEKPRPEKSFAYFEEYGKPKPLTWIVKDLIHDRGISIWAGSPGSGKSWIAEELVSACVNERPAFHNELFATKSDGPAILIDQENDYPTLYDRLKRLGGVPEKKLLLFNPDFLLSLENDDDKERLIILIKEHKPSLIVFDTFRRAFQGNENDSAVTNEIYSSILKPLSKECAVLLIVHTRKMGSKNGIIDKLSEIRGTGDITGIASSVYLVSQNKLDKKIIVEPLKMRQGKLGKSHSINIWEGDGCIRLLYEGEAKGASTRLTEANDALITWLHENKSSGDTLKACDLKKVYVLTLGRYERDFYDTLRALKQLGVLVQHEKRGPYIFSPKEGENEK